MEVDHGPVLLDNNISLSTSSLHTRSRGCAFVHNLFAGAISALPDERRTPYLKAHSTEVVALHENPLGDDRYYNNVFVRRADLSGYDKATLPVWMAGNVFFKGAKPSKHEAAPVLAAETDPGVALSLEDAHFYLRATFGDALTKGDNRKLITSELLGKASVPGMSFANPDGSPISITEDYFGTKRNPSNPTPGPFENIGPEPLKLKVR